VLDNKIEVGKIGGGVIDVTDIERVGTQRVDGRPLVHVDILNLCPPNTNVTAVRGCAAGGTDPA
jgi:hypothetical protein